MVDVNPRDLSTPYTPRETTLVDAVAETRRIADQVMRNNPLVDAIVEKGLTKFRGNYGGDYAWFGEFSPNDKNLVDDFGQPLPQRGISFVRDDPQHNSAFAMYDFDPKVGIPLRQRVYMHDSDGKALMWEGYNGGRAFPDHPIVMYPRINIESGLTNGSDDTPWTGSGNIVGNNLQFLGGVSASGTGNVTWFVRAVSQNGITVDSATTVSAMPFNINVTLDLAAMRAAGGDFVTVDLHMFRSSGTGSYFPRPTRVRTYSDFVA